MSDFRIDQITNQAGTAGPDIAGITTFSGSSGLLMPRGDTFRRSVIEDVVEEGLVLYLDAGNDVSYPGSGNKWFDLSGNGNTGTLVNGVGYSASNGGALSFDGVNDYITIPFNSVFNVTSNPFTVIIWNKKNTTSNGYNGLITADTAGDDTWKIFKDNGETYYKCRSGNSILSFPNYVVGQWHMYTFTKSGSALTNYFDGNLVGSDFSASNPSSFSNSLAIGSYRLNDAQNGFYLMDQNFAVSMFYNRALSAAEVSQNYNALKGRYT